jgi:hypothetical protein
MRRTAAGLLVLGLVLTAVRGARAQTFYLGSVAGDTAVGLLPGVEVQLPVRAANPSGYYYYLYSARLTFHYDPAAIDIIGALPDGLGITDSATTSGTFTVSGTGCVSGVDVGAFKLRVKLKPGAPAGAYIWATADTTQLFYYCYYPYGNPFAQNFTVPISQVCTSTVLFGDVDGNAKLESRDALIALSAAVGLPVNGFNLGVGDVDADGMVNSRDALMVLSYAIGLPTNGVSRLSLGVPSVCPGLTPPGESLVFRRWPPALSPNVQLMYLAAGSTTPQLVTTGADASQMVGPRLAADDATIAYYCYQADIFTSEICRIQTDGSGAAILTPTSMEALDWSPDGSQIVFGLTGRLWTMTATGGSQVQLSQTYDSESGIPAGGTPSWNRDGVRIAFLSSGNVKTINADGSSLTALTITGLSANGFRDVRWSPAGDSLALMRLSGQTSEAGVWLVGGTGGVARRAIGLTGIQPANPYGYFTNLVDWGSPGIVITLQSLGSHGLWLIENGTGAIRRLTAGEDDAPSFRRTP